jgi:catechol 2,3-dioxygenase-like lactoylglutathione lyase family enzyme
MAIEPQQAHWPAHLPAGALRVVRWSARYEETVTFYRDTIGLPVLETFHDSYGLDGTILGLPGGEVHLEIVRAGQASYPGGGLDQLVFYLPDAVAREQMEARLAAAGARPVAQIGYWQANGGVTYQDPDGREVVFASWIYIPPRSLSVHAQERCDALRSICTCPHWVRRLAGNADRGSRRRG